MTLKPASWLAPGREAGYHLRGDSRDAHKRQYWRFQLHMDTMDSTLLIVIVVLVVLFGGFGWSRRRR
ncbi:MAG: hypothetical protein ACT4OZ_14550 [Gemmatimonadota bacterium]